MRFVALHANRFKIGIAMTKISHQSKTASAIQSKKNSSPVYRGNSPPIAHVQVHDGAVGARNLKHWIAL